MIFQNRYTKKTNKSSKNSNYAHTLFINLFPLKACKILTSMDCNLRQQPFKHIIYKPKTILSFSFIIFYHKINLQKSWIFPCIPSSKIWLFRRKLITLWKIELEWQIMPQIIGIFLRYFSVALALKFNYKSAFKITKN